MNSPFDYVNAINDLNPIPINSYYEKFLVNRHFSYFIDSIHVANEANSFSYLLDNEMHFKYYLTSLRKRKRFTRWYKPADTETIQMISEFFDCSFRKAREAKDRLDDEQMKNIQDWHNERNKS